MSRRRRLISAAALSALLVVGAPLSVVAETNSGLDDAVTFPQDNTPGGIFLAVSIISGACHSKYYEPDGTLIADLTSAMHTGGNGTDCTVVDTPGNVSVNAGHSPYHPLTSLAPFVGQEFSFEVWFKNTGTAVHTMTPRVEFDSSEWGSVSVIAGSATGFGTFPSMASGATGNALNSLVTIPSGAKRLHFAIASYAFGFTAIEVRYPDTVSAGDCTGENEFSGGPGLIYGSSSLRWVGTQHDGWGDSNVDEYCVVNGSSVMQYYPFTRFVPGNRYRFDLTVQAGGSVQGYWLVGPAFAGVPYPTAVLSGPGGDTDYLGLIATVRAPPGVSGFRLVIGDGTAIHLVKVLDVTGTIDDHPLAGVTPLEDAGTSEDCPEPDGVLDLAGLASFFGCVVGRLPAAIAGFFANILYTLFVPTDLDQVWGDFVSVVDGKVPFVWVAELADDLGSMTSGAAMAGDAISFDMTLMGASVSIDPAAVSGPVSAFRPVFAGLVWFGLAWAILGQVGGSLGMHKPEAGE